MGTAVQLDSRVAEAIDPTTVDTNMVFAVEGTKAGDATHRPQYEGALDAAETVRCRAYIPEANIESVIKMTPKDLRPGRLGVERSKDGKVNKSHFEKEGVLVILWSPVNLTPTTSLTIDRS
jgi:hypothetical protein